MCTTHKEATFTAFNSQKDALVAAGVRIYSQELARKPGAPCQPRATQSSQGAPPSGSGAGAPGARHIGIRHAWRNPLPAHTRKCAQTHAGTRTCVHTHTHTVCTHAPTQDLEPEFITILPGGTKAVVSLQENNAVAVLDIPTATITAVLPLGFKEHSLAANSLDTSDRDFSQLLRTITGLKGM